MATTATTTINTPSGIRAHFNKPEVVLQVINNLSECLKSVNKDALDSNKKLYYESACKRLKDAASVTTPDEAMVCCYKASMYYRLCTADIKTH